MLDFDRDVRVGDGKAGPVLNATSPDLRSFRASGGKLIQYHGWGDAAIPAPSSIEYYETVRAFLSTYPDARTPGNPPAEDFYRLFLVPGMAHCGGGAGANSFGNGGGAAATRNDPERDIFTALERWVEQGVAPERLVGSGRATDDPSKPLTRPLCPYPQVAQYRGSGDVNDAANFTCAAPSSRQR
jgi:feruloyl esterase